MVKKVTIIYNGEELIKEELVNSSAIHYNDTIIQEDFVGDKLIKCSGKLMNDDLYIDSIVFPCKDLCMETDIEVISEPYYIHIGPKPNNPLPVVYDSNTHTNGYDISEIQGVEMTGESSGINAGTYIATYTPKEGYAWNDDTRISVNLTLTIQPREILNASIILGDSLIYNGNEQTQIITSITVDGLVLTEDDYNIINNKATIVGDYTLTVTGKGNFTQSCNKDWSISKLVLDIPYLTNKSLVYTGEKQFPTVNNYNSTWETQSGNKYTNYGTYYIKWNLNDTFNTIWTDNTTEEKSEAWNIEKATGQCYGGVDLSPTYSTASQVIIDGCKGTGTIYYSLDKSVWQDTPIQKTNVGIYTVYYKALESQNYTESSINSVSCTILAANLTSISLKNTLFTYNGSRIDIVITEVKSNSLIVPSSDYTIGGDYYATNAGDYVVKITGKNNFQGTATANWKINATTIDTFTLTQTTFNYTGGTITASVGTVTANGLTATYSTSGTWSAVNGGTYTATVTGSGNFTGSMSVNWTIQYVWNKYNCLSKYIEETFSESYFAYVQNSGGFYYSTSKFEFDTSSGQYNVNTGTYCSGDSYETMQPFQDKTDIYMIVNSDLTKMNYAVEPISFRVRPSVYLFVLVFENSTAYQIVLSYYKGSTYYGTVTSTSISTYPENGTPDNTYWYVKTW